jgi:hypothetical protein
MLIMLISRLLEGKLTSHLAAWPFRILTSEETLCCLGTGPGEQCLPLTNRCLRGCPPSTLSAEELGLVEIVDPLGRTIRILPSRTPSLKTRRWVPKSPRKLECKIVTRGWTKWELDERYWRMGAIPRSLNYHESGERLSGITNRWQFGLWVQLWWWRRRRTSRESIEDQGGFYDRVGTCWLFDEP